MDQKSPSNEIIDFDRKGNVIRFYLGKNGDQWGDDWNDCPYDCNAGGVYPEYVTDVRDISLPFDWEVLEPKDGVWNCAYSKEDMMRRKVPCLVLVSPSAINNAYCYGGFDKYAVMEQTIKVYFGDTFECVTKMIGAER